MRPTQSDVHVNGPLTNILVAYSQSEDRFIAGRACPVVPVQYKSDLYYEWKRGDFWRDEVKERAPNTPSEGGGFDITTNSFLCKEYAIHTDLADAILANADAEIDLEAAAARYVAGQLLMKREKVFNATVFKTGVWTGASTGADQTGVSGAPGANQFKQWDQAASTPIEDVLKYSTDMSEKTGVTPNTLILGARVYNALINHAEIIDRIKYTQKGVVTTDLIASLFGVDQVLVARASENTAKQGQTDAFSFVYGKSALLMYVPKGPSKMEPSACYTFAWTKREGSGPSGERVKRFYIDERAATRIEAEMAFDMKVTCPDLGVFLSGAVA